MTVQIDKKEIVIRMPVNDPPPPSKSGKSLVLASTNGNLASTATFNGKPVVIGLNAYIKAS